MINRRDFYDEITYFQECGDLMDHIKVLDNSPLGDLCLGDPVYLKGNGVERYQRRGRRDDEITDFYIVTEILPNGYVYIEG